MHGAPLRAFLALAAAGITTLVVTACGGGEGPTPSGPAKPPARPDQQATKPARAKPAVRCPAGVAGCRTVSGRVLYVERVDPDGDGDAHFVLVSREGVTAPGISIVDVRHDLRPEPLPGPGARISAAGPVFSGSRGQRQVEAVAVRVHRR